MDPRNLPWSEGIPVVKGVLQEEEISGALVQLESGRTWETVCKRKSSARSVVARPESESTVVRGL